MDEITRTHGRGMAEWMSCFLDSDITMRKHVSKTMATCYGVLRRLRTIRRSVPITMLHQLVASFVLTRLD